MKSTERRLQKAERRSKVLAFFVTILFHVGLFGGIMVASGDGAGDWIPEFVKEWTDGDSEDKEPLKKQVKLKERP